MANKDLAVEINKILTDYKKVCTEDLERVAKEVAEEGKKKLKATSPVGTSKKHYKDGWRVSEVQRTANKIGFTIHNTRKPHLTHLLENGHQMRQGGRARAFPHIKPTEEWCSQEFEKRIERELKK